jgi:transcriptional regulator with XRE-family HTH domain
VKRLHELRRRARLTQKALADRSGVPVAKISAAENGRLSLPSFEVNVLRRVLLASIEKRTEVASDTASLVSRLDRLQEIVEELVEAMRW